MAVDGHVYTSSCTQSMFILFNIKFKRLKKNGFVFIFRWKWEKQNSGLVGLLETASLYHSASGSL